MSAISDSYRSHHDSPEQYPLEAYQSINEKLKNVWSNEIYDLLKRYNHTDGMRLMEDMRAAPPSFYLSDDVGEPVYQVLLTSILGKGGCKRAIELSGGKALLIPNMSTDLLRDVQSRWPRVVHEEVEMSKFLQNIGLLGQQLQKVLVFSEEGSEGYIPAYVTDSFESLKKKNIYIIDSKNAESSTWRQEHKLFPRREDAQDPENWKPFIELLAKDIAKLVFYQLPLDGDSFNIAIERTKDGDKIRYFGFDFTNKATQIEIPVISETTFSEIQAIPEEKLIERIKNAFSTAMALVLRYEFELKVGFSHEQLSIIEALSKTYSNDILQEVHALSRS